MHVRRWHSAAGRRFVDDVVMDQRAGMQQFQCGEQSQGAVADRVAGVGGGGPVAPVGECRAESLSAEEDEVLENRDKAVVVGSDVGRPGTAVGQISAQLPSDGAGEFGGRRRCFDVQRGAPSRVSGPRLTVSPAEQACERFRCPLHRRPRRPRRRRSAGRFGRGHATPGNRSARRPAEPPPPARWPP